MNNTTILTPVVPNVWILTSAPTVVLTGIMLICPDEAPRFIKTQTPIHILHLPPACSTASQNFHLPPCYETHQLNISISLNTANLNVMNISSPDFRICQHLEGHWNGSQLHALVDIPSVPIDQLYRHMINSNGPITPFISTDELTYGLLLDLGLDQLPHPLLIDRFTLKVNSCFTQHNKNMCTIRSQSRNNSTFYL